MKRNSIISFFILLIFSILLVACQNNEQFEGVVEETFGQSIIEVETDNTDESVELESKEAVEIDEVSKPISDTRIFELDIEDEEYEAFVKSTIKLSEKETIEKSEWVEENVCYRVSVEHTTELEGEYKHLEDYIFVKEDTIKCVQVTYPSKFESMDADRYVYDACNFEVKYEDITFDGHRDIVISLGHQGAAGTGVSCAYVFADGEFVYVKSFELIPNYSINDAEKCIEGFYEDKTFKYKFVDDQFVELQ